MTVWRPLTCSCVIEYDKNKVFVRAINKCKSHENLTGQTLLNTIVKDNKRETEKNTEKEKGFWRRLLGK